MGLAVEHRPRSGPPASNTNIEAILDGHARVHQGHARGATKHARGGMAKAVIGGLAAASFLTLFVVPTVYTVFAKKDMPAAPAENEVEAPT